MNLDGDVADANEIIHQNNSTGLDLTLPQLQSSYTLNNDSSGPIPNAGGGEYIIPDSNIIEVEVSSSHSELKFQKKSIFKSTKSNFLTFSIKYKNTFFAISKMAKNPFLLQKKSLKL